VTGVFQAQLALDKMAEQPFDVLVSGLRMPDIDGLTLMKRAKEIFPDIIVIMITAFGTVENAVEAMRQGAYDYILKPFDIDKLLMVLDRVEAHQQLALENRQLKAQLAMRSVFTKSLAKVPRCKRCTNLWKSSVAVIARYWFWAKRAPVKK
jgi:DNA-binding NtrC family response regulator